MPVEKNNETVQPGVVANFKEYRFPKEYAKWASDLASLRGEDIGTKPSAGNLLDQIVNHVKKPRPKSRNDGNSGAFETIEKIQDILNSNEVFKLENKKVLRRFLNELEALKTHETLNPRNTLFHEPEEWDEVDGKLVIDSESKIEIYGHFRTPFFEAKSKGKMPVIDSDWYSETPNTATPPYWIALFGREHSLGGKSINGLEIIIKNCLNEIDSTPIAVEFTSGYKMNANAAKKLASVSAVRNAISGLLKNKTLWDGSRFKAKEAGEALGSKPLKLKGKDIERINEILGIVGQPTITLKLNRKQFMALYSQLDVYSRTSNFNERESPVNGEKIVVKSWADILRA